MEAEIRLTECGLNSAKLCQAAVLLVDSKLFYPPPNTMWLNSFRE